MVVTEQDDVDGLDIEAKFHAAVKAVVTDTLELFKDDKYVRKLVKKGKYDELAEYVTVVAIVQADFDASDIVRATEKKKGLQKLAVDAAFGEQVRDLEDSWVELVTTSNLLPSLTWPVVKP